MPAPKGNKFYKLIKDVGAKPFYSTPEELKNKAEEYIVYCERNNLPLGVSAMAYYLGFESRQSLYDYKKKEGFTFIIKRIILAVESKYESNLCANNPTGSIFALKNMGWKDTQHNVNQSIEVEIPDNEPGNDNNEPAPNGGQD